MVDGFYREDGIKKAADIQEDGDGGQLVTPKVSAEVVAELDPSLIGAVDETAPTTDTASSGLNGRLQRVAQRLTSLIGLMPASIGQKNKAGSLPVALASDDALLALIGEVQASPTANTVLDRLKRLETAAFGLGVSASADFTPAASPYLAGDIMDVAKEFSFTDRNGVLVPTASLIRILTAVVKIDVTAVPSGQTSYTLHLYSVTPPSAQADNDAWTLASGDLTSYRGSINLGSPLDLGSALYVKSQYIDFDIRLPSNTTSLFGVLVTAGAHTPAAVARQITLHAVAM